MDAKIRLFFNEQKKTSAKKETSSNLSYKKALMDVK